MSRRPSSFTRRLQAWFAIAILSLSALAPSISAAVSHVRGDAIWQEICTSAGSTSGKKMTELEKLTQGHCALCHLQAQDLALPPAPAQAVLRQDLQFAMPERFYSAPATAHAWRAAPARAPPTSV